VTLHAILLGMAGRAALEGLTGGLTMPEKPDRLGIVKTGSEPAGRLEAEL
jgi:hypothetical protein